MKDNSDGTVTVSLGKKNGDVTFIPSPATLQTTGLNRYFNFLGDMLTAMGNT